MSHLLLVGSLGAALATPSLLEAMEVRDSVTGQSALQMTLGHFLTLVRNLGTGAVLIGLLSLITAVIGNQRADSPTDPRTDVA